MSQWINGGTPPEKRGVYNVCILTRILNKDDGTDYGACPPHDEYWEDHANIYSQLSNGRWIEQARRVWNGERWSGYDETVVAWMSLPEPPVEVPEVEG